MSRIIGEESFSYFGVDSFSYFVNKEGDMEVHVKDETYAGKTKKEETMMGAAVEILANNNIAIDIYCTKTVMDINDFEGVCGYSYTHEPYCNGGHNCKHPDACKENVNGESVGYCYAFACPLAPSADEADFVDAGLDAENYEEDMYVVVCSDEIPRCATNIEWDTDEENVDLPSEIFIPEHVKEEDIENYLSGVTGYCHKGFDMKGGKDAIKCTK